MQLVEAAREKRYYHDLGRSHDALLRCKDCKRLITHKKLVKRGSCTCGCRRSTEIVTLTAFEWFKIRFGLIRFPNRREFLAEFPTLWEMWRRRT